MEKKSNQRIHEKTSKALFVAVLLTVAMVGLPALLANSPAGLAFYMPFDGPLNTDTVAVDMSGNGNDGTVVGATFDGTGGKFGGAYHFDGTDDYIEVANDPVLSPDEITVEMWVYPKALKSGSGGDAQMLLDKFAWQTSGYAIWLFSDGTINWNVGTKASNTGPDWTVGEWQHIAMTANSTHTNMYRNGVVLSPKDVPWSGTLTRAKNLRIGGEARDPWEDPNSFDGTIDEVRIYDYAKTPAEILDDYLAEPPVDTDGDGVLDGDDLCPDTGLPESVPTRRLMPFHYADVDGDLVFETRSVRKQIVEDSVVLLPDTYGCSCEQILDIKPGKNKLEEKFGCRADTLIVWLLQRGWAAP